MRKAVIAVPPVRDFYFTPRRATALGAGVLDRELKKTGWKTSLLNLPLMDKPRTVPLPDELEYLNSSIIPGETGPLSWFTAFRRFGPLFSDAAEIIAREKPDTLFISSFAWAYAEEARRLAEAAARRMPELPIVIGGHGPSSLPEYFLNASHPVFPEKPLFTRVISGEIEGRGEVLKINESGIRYLDLRDLKSNREIKPVAGESVIRAGRRSISIILTRGCPKKCRFCSNHICHGRIFRSSPPNLWEEEVIRIAEQISGRNGKIHLNIEDDNILFLKKDFFDFLGSLKRQFSDITFTAENGLDYMFLEENDINRLKKNGFTHLNLSLGVLSDNTRTNENRAGNTEKLAKLIQRCREVDLPLTTHFICGLAGDSSKDIVQTLRFLDGLPTQIGISNFYPVPGLEGFTDTEVFLNNPPRLALGSSVYPWTGALSSTQLITAFRLSRWSNFRKKMERSLLPDTEFSIEKELYSRIKKSHQLHTIHRERGKDRERVVVPVEHLDETMVAEFFS